MLTYPTGISTKEQRKHLRYIINHQPVVRRAVCNARQKAHNNAARTGIPISNEAMSILTLTAAHRTARYIQRQRLQATAISWRRKPYTDSVQKQHAKHR